MSSADTNNTYYEFYEECINLVNDFKKTLEMDPVNTNSIEQAKHTRINMSIIDETGVGDIILLTNTVKYNDIFNIVCYFIESIENIQETYYSYYLPPPIVNVYHLCLILYCDCDCRHFQRDYYRDSGKDKKYLENNCECCIRHRTTETDNINNTGTDYVETFLDYINYN